jgi:hypothetical protein
MDNETKDLTAGLKKFKHNVLDEVRADAKFNYLRRLKEQQEKAEYEEAKTQGYGAVDEFVDREISQLKTSSSAKKGK